MPEALIESLDHEGRGVAHVDNKVIFIEGALPGERVEYVSYHRKPRYEQAQATAVLRASSQRVAPRCPHFGVCGGCSMQHLALSAQLAAKQRVLEDALWHLARLKPEVFYPPITGPAWGYRYRARLSVRLVAKKGGILVGFHEKRKSFVAKMDSCEVLPHDISALLPNLKTLIEELSTPNRLPQIEIALGDGQKVLVLRHLEALTSGDEMQLRTFADRHGIVWYLQPNGPASVHLFYPADVPPLAYSLPEFGLSLRFGPTDFTQVNYGVNRLLVRRAMNLLDPLPGERIADMFCGLGNFTLPIARLGAHVVGIEGSRELVARARSNAELNGLAASTEFAVANLFEATAESLAALGRFDKMLIDPPRDGAVALVNALGEDAPRRIVYVSCKPATLARDAAILVHENGYCLRGAGIANMFPHTSHVESIALFERA
ncbi:23S rRNA (uracil(1939)-C(5))-methyltransferase RlmD [Georgfuchsia toluolica]|uniref:23S rRNA (uracil(1939)-C(5))-methyltransferase RlmD n=1 Tax=Georgfuchsia toluolica TaxID=424218 RepID=A0A916J2K0_9PROT|nr:23S rRNA (uracil(1939)-C(5))-methyltransferase RlmD [Georgfuchsia toluolica]CAG4882972.1 23S rRNA (uracil(1939)-C(5))-methyltransferase RlmD [Georgfuchsia toluolica]